MCKSKRTTAFLICLFFAVHICGINSGVLIKQMEQRLTQHLTYQEQVMTLYNLIDLSRTSAEEMRNNNRLYRLAVKHDDVELQLEALRNYANSEYLDTLKYYLHKAVVLPPLNAQKETVVLLRLFTLFRVLDFETDSQRSAYLTKIISDYKVRKNTDLYGKVSQLFSLCSAMSYFTEGTLYQEYLESLEKLINSLPADGRNALPNAYYVLAANYYSQHDNMQKQAYAANLKLISLMRQLEIKYRKAGRIYRNYDTFYYSVYSRMLIFYSILSKKQIEEYYGKLRILAKRNKECREDFTDPSSLENIRYCMGTKQYSKVLPILYKYVSDKKTNALTHEECLKYYIQAARKAHDNKYLLNSALLYIDYLEHKGQKDIAEKYRELQIVYDVHGLESKVSSLELEKKEAEVDASHKLNRIYLTVLIIFVVLLCITLWLLYRSNKLTHSLKASKTVLQEKQLALSDTMKKLEVARDKAEVANKLKTMFIQNMSHEIRTPLNIIVGFSKILVDSRYNCKIEDQKQYTDLISENSELLLTLVSDVLDIARMESGEMEYSFNDCSLNMLCNMALDNVKHRAKPGVKIYFNKHENDIILRTDLQRTEQVLINYLTNACKFTDKGEIVLDYQVDNENKKVIMSVTDTGKGIPSDKAEVIFQRFEKLDSFIQGSGLGLHICSLIAKALNGEVKLDTTYQNGSRFLFILPLPN
jgi:signal transduction histidine kinase